MAAQNFEIDMYYYNFFARYRHRSPNNYVDRNAQQVQAYYRLHNYQVPLAQLQSAAPQYHSLGSGRPLTPPPAHDANPRHRQFLDSVMPKLMDDPAQAVHWKGTKWLGEGTFGRAGLWEYTDPDPNSRRPRVGRKVVVKEMKPHAGPEHTLLWEAKILRSLSKAASPHIVKIMLDPPEEENNRDVDEFGVDDEGILRRIFLEYCELGSLYDLIIRRIQLGVRFNELTLWRFFDCLVDGLCALEYCHEAQSGLVGGEFWAEKPEYWLPIVHFDLKPDNVLLADKRNTHATHPICKVADFGHARRIKQPQGLSPKDLHLWESWRAIGTPGYLAPEQFTERWDYADWVTTDIAGVYGSATNVWGIGCIMYQLVVLSVDGPDPKDPFVPQYSLNGALPKGITYGVDLSMYPYSDSLLDLIQECLYERPSNRPRLLDLKRKAYHGMEACIQAGDSAEPWIDFLPAEPLPPDIANPPPLPALPAQPTRAQKIALQKARRENRIRAARDEKKQAQTAKNRNRVFVVICRHFDPNDKQCKNRFKTTGAQIYCTDHGGQ